MLNMLVIYLLSTHVKEGLVAMFFIIFCADKQY